MKIMLIEPRGKYPGHYSVYVSGLTRAFTIEHEVTVVSYDGLLEDRLPSDVEHFAVAQRSGLANMINSILPSPKALLYHHIYDFVATFLTIMYAKILLRTRPHDILHIADGDVLCILLFGNILSNIVFISLHNVVPIVVRGRKNKDYRWYEHLIIKIMNAFVDWFLRGRIRKNSFIFHSRENLETYKGTGYFSDTRYIPLAIEDKHAYEVETFREENGITEKIFLIFGRNSIAKCYELVFKVFSDLDFRDFKLLFVGKIFYKDINNPHVLSDMYNLKENTIVIDEYVPEEDIPKYFLSADAILLPYSKKFLSASAVLSHSLEYHIPVIASDVGQMGRWVSQNKLGITFMPEDTGSLRKSVEHYLSMSDSEIEEIKRNIKRFSKKYSWSNIGDAYIRYYRREKVQNISISSL